MNYMDYQRYIAQEQQRQYYIQQSGLIGFGGLGQLAIHQNSQLSYQPNEDTKNLLLLTIEGETE